MKQDMCISIQKTNYSFKAFRLVSKYIDLRVSKPVFASTKLNFLHTIFSFTLDLLATPDHMQKKKLINFNEYTHILFHVN
jgi:hypothetical protein